MEEKVKNKRKLYYIDIFKMITGGYYLIAYTRITHKSCIYMYIYITYSHKLLSSSLLSKNLKIKIYRTIILPVVLYGCETWSLTLREKHRLSCLRTGC